MYAINFLKYFSFNHLNFYYQKRFPIRNYYFDKTTIVDFPAPDGPKIELIFPILKINLIFKIYFSLLSYLKKYYQILFHFLILNSCLSLY